MTFDQMRRVCPKAPEAWLVALLEIPQGYGIDTPNELASFVAQLAHESHEFKRLEENLNYSAVRLTQVWPKRFPTMAAAVPYAWNPKHLANRVYAGRYGNGDEASGDGWAFRGRGPIMLTFRDNYRRYGERMGLDLVVQPDLLLTPDIGIRAACEFWKDKRLDRFDDDDTAETESRIVNGGTIGMADRQKYLDLALEAFA